MPPISCALIQGRPGPRDPGTGLAVPLPWERVLAAETALTTSNLVTEQQNTSYANQKGNLLLGISTKSRSRPLTVVEEFVVVQREQ
jgi:hypothetical protein